MESEGGLANYARFQSAALQEAGFVDVHWIGPEGFPAPSNITESSAIFAPAGKRSLLPGKIRAVRRLWTTFRQLDGILEKRPPDALLLSTWGEYLAPMWAWRLRRLRNRGIRIGAVVHDPVRDFILGPRWFHDWSLREAVSFLDLVFVHGSESEMSLPQAKYKTTTIPHGPFPVEQGSAGSGTVRTRLGIPVSAFVVLSFGHIRDGKNLDLLLKAMVDLPEVWLLVAGREQSSGQRPVAHYQSLAEDLGVGDRCRWQNAYIPDDEIRDYFEAADVVAVTYSSDFRSASGVLNLNAQFEKPVLASSGPGPLKSMVEAFGLGKWVVPDSSDALREGLLNLMNARPVSHDNWMRYARENSWEQNAKTVWEAFGELEF
jgi:glycosyltransferase involved in cell wall biosynthesis